MKKVMLFVISAVLLLGLVSSQASWKQYGGDLTYMWNSQFPSYSGVFNSTNVNISSSSLSYYFPFQNYTQPLVSSLGYNESDSGFRQYLVIPFGSYLQIYDKYFTFYDEINTYGNINGQISIVDFNKDGFSNEIVGLWNYTYFRIYSYNTSSNKYSLLNYTDLNASYGLVSVAGVRSSGYNSYFAGLNSSGAFFLVTANSPSGKDIYINKTQIGSSLRSSLPYSEPLSFGDFDLDGNLEFIHHDRINGFAVFNIEDGSVILSKNNSDLGGNVLDVKAIKTDATGQWRIAVLYSYGAGYHKINVYRLDSSDYWNKIILSGGGAYQFARCKMAVSDDYDSDYTNNDNEIYASCYFTESTGGGQSRRYLRVYKGRNGDELANFTSGILTGYMAREIEIVLADMDGDGIDESIDSSDTGYLSDSSYPYVSIWNPYLSNFTYSKNFSAGSGQPHCIPADLTVDGKLDLICTSNSTYVFFVGDIVNDNPSIISVTYTPSTTVAVSQTLSILISASDNESDQIYYSVKCSDSESWKADTTSPTQTCSYSSAGNYNNTVRIRDLYHSIYSYFSYPILVTETGGTSCNTNGVCESSLGETSVTCPADCPATPETISYQNQTEIPTKLVDIDDESAGFLPQVYSLTLKVFSVILIPLIITVFIVFGILILLTIMGIIKKLIK